MMKSLFIFASIVITLTTQNDCPSSDWVRFWNKCYRSFNTVNMGTNIELCRSWKTSVVSIHSAEENNFLKKTFNKGNYWIGVQHVQFKPMIYSWLDGSAFNYSNWHNGHDPGKTSCSGAYFQNDGTWDDHNYGCTGTAYGLCQFDLLQRSAENQVLWNKLNTTEILLNKTWANLQNLSGLLEEKLHQKDVQIEQNQATLKDMIQLLNGSLLNQISDSRIENRKATEEITRSLAKAQSQSKDLSNRLIMTEMLLNETVAEIKDVNQSLEEKLHQKDVRFEQSQGSLKDMIQLLNDSLLNQIADSRIENRRATEEFTNGMNKAQSQHKEFLQFLVSTFHKATANQSERWGAQLQKLELNMTNMVNSLKSNFDELKNDTREEKQRALDYWSNSTKEDITKEAVVDILQFSENTSKVIAFCAFVFLLSLWLITFLNMKSLSRNYASLTKIEKRNVRNENVYETCA